MRQLEALDAAMQEQDQADEMERQRVAATKATDDQAQANAHAQV